MNPKYLWYKWQLFFMAVGNTHFTLWVIDLGEGLVEKGIDCWPLTRYRFDWWQFPIRVCCNHAPLALWVGCDTSGYHGYGLRPSPFARQSRAVGAAFGEIQNRAKRARRSQIQNRANASSAEPNSEGGGRGAPIKNYRWGGMPQRCVLSYGGNCCGSNQIPVYNLSSSFEKEMSTVSPLWLP